MPRSTPEWIGASDDANAPDRVKLRVWTRCGGRCQSCERKLMDGGAKHYDHKTPLEDGGENRESNLQLLCAPCHGIKTAGEATDRASVRRKAKGAAGIKKKSSLSHPYLRKRMDGRVEDKRTGEIVR